MRTTTFRTAILALLLACALPATAGANATSNRIYTDCEHSASGNLTGSYTKAQLNAALQSIPGDVAEYSGCYDAIKQALLAGGHGGPGGGGGNRTGTPGGGGGVGGGGSPGGGTPATGGSAPAVGGAAGGPAIAHASGSKAPVQLAGSTIEPGVVPTLGTGSSALPAPLMIFLILLAAGAVALGATTIGRRVIARRRA